MTATPTRDDERVALVAEAVDVAAAAIHELWCQTREGPCLGPMASDRKIASVALEAAQPLLHQAWADTVLAAVTDRFAVNTKDRVWLRGHIYHLKGAQPGRTLCQVKWKSEAPDPLARPLCARCRVEARRRGATL